MDLKLDELYYTQKDNMAFYNCDYLHKAKISAILKFSAEAAGQAYTVKGLNHEFLWEKGFVFLLSRISFHVNRFPTQREDILTTTWECGKKGAMFLRGFEMTDQSGEVCIDGQSAWVLVNPESRKIYRPSQFPWQMPYVTDRETKALPLEKIETESLIKIGEHIVRIPDLDANGHVYNANYADIAAEFMSVSLYEKETKDFRINFINEAKLGDVIEIMLGETEERTVIIGMAQDKVCFECEYWH